MKQNNEKRRSKRRGPEDKHREGKKKHTTREDLATDGARKATHEEGKRKTTHTNGKRLSRRGARGSTAFPQGGRVP